MWGGSNAPGEGAKQVVEQALRELTNMRFNFASLHAGTVRVVWWYRLLFPFLPAPLVVIHTLERSNEMKFAELAGAVHILTTDYNVQVIVTGVDSSLEPELFRTGRQRLFSVNMFETQQIADFQEFSELFRQLKHSGEGLERLRSPS